MIVEDNANIDGSLFINLKNKYYRVYNINDDIAIHVLVDLNEFQINLDNSWVLDEKQYIPYVGHARRRCYNESLLSDCIDTSKLNNIEVCMKEIQIDDIIKRILEDNDIKINSFKLFSSGNFTNPNDCYKEFKNVFNKEYIKKFVPNDYSISMPKLFYEYIHEDHPQGLDMGKSLNYKTNLNDNIYITISKT